VQKPPNLPTSPGVYIVVHILTKVAYIGKCADLRHRAAIWTRHFKNKEKNPSYEIPISGLPVHPSSEWQFIGYPTSDLGAIRAKLLGLGVTFVNKGSRTRDLITFRGKSASLAEHAKDAGIPYTMAYSRKQAGKSLDEIFYKGEQGGN